MWWKMCIYKCMLNVYKNQQNRQTGIWWVQKCFPQYGVPIWSLWPNIRFLSSIVAEKNATKNEHICSMCIKINKVGKQKVGIWWVQKRFPWYGVPIWSLWPNIRFLPSIFAEKNEHICSMCIKINKVGKQEVGIWRVQKRFPQYGIPIWSLWPNIRFLSSIVAEKNILDGRTDRQTEVKQYTPSPSRERGYKNNIFVAELWKENLNSNGQQFHLWNYERKFKQWWSTIATISINKMNCELMLTYDTPALWQTGSRNLTGQKMLPTIWGTYMKLVTKYQISAINSCWEKCDEKCGYMFNVYKNQLSRQTESRNLTGPKMLPTIWIPIWSLWPNIRFLSSIVA
jgi:hypothetical protein